MAFLKRLGWYLLGLSVGLVFLMFFLKKKSEETGAEFCYLPNCRVLKDMRSKPLVISPVLDEELAALALDSISVRSFLEDGKVDFSKSDTDAKPCKKYVVTKEVRAKIVKLSISNCSEQVTVEAVSVLE